MRRRLYMPAPVRQAIRTHIQSATALAADEYPSAAEDEDAMTGHFGARLQIGPQTVLVTQDELAGEWKWSIRYRKFRGRGPRATESYLGADGIFELTLDLGNRRETKSLLFQAKMADQGGRKLLEQSIKLSTWREAAVIVEYAPSGFGAFSVDDVVAARGNVKKSTRVPLADLLGGRFVDCEVGDNDLKYDASARRLVWRTMDGEVVAVTFVVANRVEVRVQAPKHGTGMPGVDRIVEPGELHRFRMEARDQEVLAVSSSADAEKLKASHKRLALAYHPDRMADGEQLLRDLLNRRTQEFNDAYARLRQK